MVLLGTIVNALAIILGTLLGKFLTRIPETVKVTVMQAIGLSVILLGVQMGLQSENFVLVIFSLVLGGILGELMDFDGKLNALGRWLEIKVGAGHGSIAEGFVTATLIFVIGAMGILGSLDSGIRNDHRVLFTKSLLDGFMSLLLTTTLGIGVLFSSVPVFLYQGAIALGATQIERFVPEQLMNQLITEMTATGGVMIMAIGINLLEIKMIRVANLLPGIVVVIILITSSYLVK
jgi:uncharacterized membrane protein YqgA involved in biofilm formation